MTSLLAALHLDSPDSLKRALASGLGFIVLLLVNPFLQSKGLPTVSDGEIASAAAVLAVFIAQSGAKSIAAAKQAGADAAATVTTPEDAAKVLAAPATPEVKP